MPASHPEIDESAADSSNHHDSRLDSPRSLDDFIEAAIATTSSQQATTTTSMNFHHWRYWLIFLSLGMANSSDASEILCISYILSLQDFQTQVLLQSHGSAGVLAAAVFCGMLVGGLLVGPLGDYRGRRPMLLLGLAMNCVAGILSACSTRWVGLCVIRFMAGVGIGATVPPLFTLCSELPAAVDRGFWVTLCASFWMVGSIYVAVAGWFLLQVMECSWRIFVVACALPSAIGWIMVYCLVPESPRFLLLQGRYERAAATANYLAECMGSLLKPLSEQELKEHDKRQQQAQLMLHSSTDMPADYIAARGFVATPPTEQSLGEFLQSTYADFVESIMQLYTISPQLKHTTMVLQAIWFSLSFGSYGLLTWINTLFVEVHLDNVYRNALLFALANLPGNILSAIFMDRLGRTKLLIASILLASASLLVFAEVVAASDEQKDADGEEEVVVVNIQRRARIIVAAACLFQCFSISAWNAIDVLTGELFPTVVRASGMGICAASGRIGAMLAQFVNGALMKQPVRLLVVAALTLIVGAIAPLSLPADKTGKPVNDRVVEPLQRSVAGSSYQPLATRHPE